MFHLNLDDDFKAVPRRLPLTSRNNLALQAVEYDDNRLSAFMLVSALIILATGLAMAAILRADDPQPKAAPVHHANIVREA